VDVIERFEHILDFTRMALQGFKENVDGRESFKQNVDLRVFFE